MEITFFLWHARISYFVGPTWWWPLHTAYMAYISNLFALVTAQSWKGFDRINETLKWALPSMVQSTVTTQSLRVSLKSCTSRVLQVDYSLCYSKGLFSSHLESMLSELIINYPQRGCFCFCFFNSIVKALFVHVHKFDGLGLVAISFTKLLLIRQVMREDFNGIHLFE